MAKTGKQIQGDIYRMLRDSTLYELISGEVYRNGYRPRDSRKEDAVVTFTAGLPDEIQTGVVTVNIYVPDIDPADNGAWIEDGERTEEIEALAAAWVDSLTAEVSCYRFKLSETIFTMDDAEINQHFIVVKLRYRYFGDDNAPIAIPQMAMIDISDTDDDRGYMPVLETSDGDIVIIQPTISKQLTIKP